MTRSVTYCSFADDSGCLGVIILRGSFDVIEAATIAHRLLINPGGEVIAMEANENDPDVPGWLFEAMWTNCDRLISKEEAASLFDACSIREHRESLN